MSVQRPKRPMSAFLIWLSTVREQIKEENPGIKVPEVGKIAGRMWRNMKDKSEWHERAAKLKEKYRRDLAEYNARMGSGEGNHQSGCSSSSSCEDEDTE